MYRGTGFICPCAKGVALKKRIFTLLLTLCLLTVPAHAAENSMDNFMPAPDGPAYAGQFSDVPSGHTFYENIAALYELGLTIGKADGTFGPADHISVSQAVIFAGRIRSLYRTGDPEAGPAAHQTEAKQAVCAPYLAYLQAEGIVGNELDSLLFAPATRAQMAHLLANLLPEDALPPINRAIITDAYARRIFITDVNEYTPYQQDILRLYHCGVVRGSDENGSFLPNSPITRGAAAAMLTRLVTPDLRMELVWAEPEIPDVSQISYRDLIKPGRYYPTPQTAEELDAVVRYMLYLEQNQLTLRYSDLTEAQGRELMQELLKVMKTYCEQGYNSVQATVDTDHIRFTFSDGTGKNISAHRAATLDAAKAMHDELWKQGYLTADMTEYDKARMYYIWLCSVTEYDTPAKDDSLSHSPYGLFQNGLAVCDGYTGAYNLLLKLEGIDCHAYLTEDHIWTVATLDGTEVHIDTTWGDTGTGANSLFFAMTPEDSLLLHEAME